MPVGDEDEATLGARAGGWRELGEEVHLSLEREQVRRAVAAWPSPSGQ